MLTLYGLKNCDTCRKALRWLKENDIQHQFIDYRAEPIDKAQLRQYAQALGWPKLVNRASMTWRKLDESEKNPASDDNWLALVATHPTLIRRPLAVNGGDDVRVGFKADDYQTWLAAS